MPPEAMKTSKKLYANWRKWIGSVIALYSLSSCVMHVAGDNKGHYLQNAQISNSEIRIPLDMLRSVLSARKAIWKSTDDISSEYIKLAWNMPLWTDSIGSWIPLAPYLSPELSKLLHDDYTASETFKESDFQSSNKDGHPDRTERYTIPLTPGAKNAQSATEVYSSLSEIPTSKYKITRVGNRWIAIGQASEKSGKINEFRVVFGNFGNERSPRIVDIEKRIWTDGNWVVCSSFKEILSR